jgi:hypothetical protein
MYIPAFSSPQAFLIVNPLISPLSTNISKTWSVGFLVSTIVPSYPLSDLIIKLSLWNRQPNRSNLPLFL